LSHESEWYRPSRTDGVTIAVLYHNTTLLYVPVCILGVITVSECEQASTGIPCSGGSGWGKLVIDLKGPYTVSFNHVSFVADGLGVDESEPSTSNRVVAGQLVGYSGDTTPPGYSTGPHVHMSVLLDDGEYVDPYGWTGAGDDPYRHRSVNVRLWKAQP